MFHPYTTVRYSAGGPGANCSDSQPRCGPFYAENFQPVEKSVYPMNTCQDQPVIFIEGLQCTVQSKCIFRRNDLDYREDNRLCPLRGQGIGKFICLCAGTGNQDLFIFQVHDSYTRFQYICGASLENKVS